MAKDRILGFMSEQKLGVLSSVSPEGASQCALVGIAVTPEFEIIFDTVNSSRKFRNLVANPRCSFVVGWAGEVTVQFEGEAHQPAGESLVHYQQIYFTRWPDGPSRLNWPGITYFVVRPKWIRYSDFDQSPPLIEAWRF